LIDDLGPLGSAPTQFRIIAHQSVSGQVEERLEVLNGELPGVRALGPGQDSVSHCHFLILEFKDTGLDGAVAEKSVDRHRSEVQIHIVFGPLTSHIVQTRKNCPGYPGLLMTFRALMAMFFSKAKKKFWEMVTHLKED